MVVRHVDEVVTSTCERNTAADSMQRERLRMAEVLFGAVDCRLSCPRSTGKKISFQMVFRTCLHELGDDH